jgi:glucose/arabinose dehydrogenase
MRIVVWLLLAVLLAVVLWIRGCGGGRRLNAISLPRGFRLALYADSVSDARSLALGSNGTVFVGSRGAGVVYALRDTNRDGTADEVIRLLQGLDTPNGVAFNNGSLYVATLTRILRYDSIEARLKNPPQPVVVTDRLPAEEHHGWRYIGVGPDGWLYVASGAPCDVCKPTDERFAAILRTKIGGSGRLDVFAAGVRNSVGFDWHPATRELWFTDNGRDWLGPDAPPDELNRAPVVGSHFGFPFCHGGTIVDPDLGAGHRCADYAPPERTLGAHVAALGMRFYSGQMFPADYRGQIFIAEHGSWNRIIPVGYRITLVRLENGRAASYTPFAKGWLRGGTAWGRPVDILVMPDGALLVSDDKAGVVYRISYPGGR